MCLAIGSYQLVLLGNGKSLYCLGSSGCFPTRNYSRKIVKKKKKKKSREKVCEMSAITTDLELTQVGSF